MNSEETIEKLQRRILFLERENRQLQGEVNDYVLREKELMDNISELEGELSAARAQVVRYRNVRLQTPHDKEEFLSPYLPDTFQKGEGVGYEEEWSDFMYAYTDELFIESDEPDLLLYRDEREKCFRSESGSTRLHYPISKADLDGYNILKIRPLTSEEEEELAKTL